MPEESLRRRLSPALLFSWFVVMDMVRGKGIMPLSEGAWVEEPWVDGFCVVAGTRCCWRGVVGCCAALVVCVNVVVEGGVVVLLFDIEEGRELMSGGDIIVYVSRI